MDEMDDFEFFSWVMGPEKAAEYMAMRQRVAADIAEASEVSAADAADMADAAYDS